MIHTQNVPKRDEDGQKIRISRAREDLESRTSKIATPDAFSRSFPRENTDKMRTNAPAVTRIRSNLVVFLFAVFVRALLVVALDASSSTSSGAPLLQAGVPTSFSRGSSKYLAAVLGAPNAAGQRREGVERAPSILRAAGIVNDIRALGWDARDLGDAHEPKPPVPSPPHGPPGPPTVSRVRKTNAWRDADAAALHEMVARRVHDAKTSGAVPLILGGDHSVAIGSIAGALRDDPALSVIWIDAHADVNTPQVSETGNLHGMSLAMVAGLADRASWPDGAYDWLLKDDDDFHDDRVRRVQPRLDLRRLVYVGLRDVDPPEADRIANLGIKAFTAERVRSLGAQRVARLALDHLRVANGGDAPTSLHVSLDVDSLDPTRMNATGTPVPDGLELADVVDFLRETRRGAAITSADLVELNVEVVDEATRGGYVNTAKGLARALLGEAGCAEPARDNKAVTGWGVTREKSS